MPIANKYDLSEVLEACDYYFEKTGRRITFEYSLVHGVNDRDEDAEELITILKHRNCHINLIPVKIEEKTKDDFFDIIPNLMSNINVNDIIKNIKAFGSLARFPI